MIDNELIQAIRIVVREETDDIRQDVSGLKEDVSGLKGDVCSLKMQYNTLDQRTLDMSAQLNTLEDMVYRNNMLLENDIKPAVQQIADGHRMLWEKLENEKKERYEATTIITERLSIDVRSLQANVDVLNKKVGLA